jgi:hypothetical protein
MMHGWNWCERGKDGKGIPANLTSFAGMNNETVGLSLNNASHQFLQGGNSGKFLTKKKNSIFFFSE